ncbi:MAG: pilus assembly PilX N-terminal domain-containing protein [Planctomycetes bacterium]|nr:pilus assembly PilX N-terminal domain-containing protein [Planctomycetota bacterium]
MLRKKRHDRKKQNGIALILALVFVAIFSTLSMAMFTMSSSNTLIADNLHEANEARTAAESGLEIIRYYVEQITISSSVAEEDRFTTMAPQLVTLINNTAGSGSAYYHVYDPDNPHIHVGFSGSPVMLSDTGNKGFYARLTPDGTNGINISITGNTDSLERTIATGFTYGTRPRSVFDYGIATKGPLLMSGQTSVAGVNLAVESDVFIDTDTIPGDSFSIDNKASVAGDVHIVDENAGYSIGTKSSIGGETGEDAIDHVFVGVDPVDFPFPDTEYFRQYATGDVIDSSTNISNYAVLNNVTIAANTNPTFASHIEINGVLFIEQPNNVTFAGQVDITGVIVGSSEVGTNVGSLDFSGQVICSDVSTLEGSEFEDIKSENGTFIMAPGFSGDFSGQANTINGAVALGGVRFTGQAGGVVNGSIINYSDDPMVLQGQSELLFNRSGITEIPAGFVQETVIHYNPSSYEEIL